VTKEDASRLFEHMWWADERVMHVLSRDANPPDRALRLYTHLLAAENVWMDRILGNTPTVPIWPEPNLAACRTMAQRARENSRILLNTPVDFGRVVHYTNSAGQPFDTRLDDILLQVVLHGAYHRGQIALLLRDGGFEPSPTDYILYVRGFPAAGGATRPG
jgi:uncharacterized damage-inducible protein DinB